MYSRPFVFAGALTYKRVVWKSLCGEKEFVACLFPSRLLERVIAHDIGLYEKQSSPLFQAKAALTTVRDSVFFNLPRAAVNFNDGFGGGNDLRNNLMFNGLFSRLI